MQACENEKELGDSSSSKLRRVFLVLDVNTNTNVFFSIFL